MNKLKSVHSPLPPTIDLTEACVMDGSIRTKTAGVQPIGKSIEKEEDLNVPWYGNKS